VPVQHQGNTNSSIQEANAVAGILASMLTRTWRCAEGIERPVEPRDVLVVTPYNAQIRTIEAALGTAGLLDIQVGTVDKFQGRQAPVVIYSMASSSASEAPRGMEFLFDLHRLNVATSRAQALAVIVASPELVRVFCGTPRQMRLANAMCEAWDRGLGA
jgi:uncharacterized protein